MYTTVQVRSEFGKFAKKTVGMETLDKHFFANGIYFVQKN
jgi:hypothetical protein